MSWRVPPRPLDRPAPAPRPAGWYWNGERWVHAAAESGPRLSVGGCVALPFVLVGALVGGLRDEWIIWRRERGGRDAG